MTVSEAIERAENICRYNGEPENLIVWLSELEKRILTELYHSENHGFEKLSMSDRLVAPDAYAELYPLYLVMKISFLESDIIRYNNSSAIFNRVYSDYANYLIRTRLPEKTVYYNIL